MNDYDDLDPEDEMEEDREDSELEAQFRKVYDEKSEEISAEIELARKHLTKAVKLSEKYGIPFNGGISFLNNVYTPDSLDQKFPDLDAEFIEEVVGIYISDSDYSYGGWEHSAVC